MATEITLAPELALEIQKILEIDSLTKDDDISGDNDQESQSNPFDAPPHTFDVVAVLNAFFPDESSLAKLESTRGSLAQMETALQKEIDELQASLAHAQDPERMALIQEMISDLLGQMSRIREKATESEAVVRTITRDIQALDRAKANIVASMTTLKRLQMLANGLTQLEELVQSKKYAEIAQTLRAVKELGASFKPLMSVPQIAQLWARIHTIQAGLRILIDADFDLYYVADPARPIKSSTISAACLAADALGAEARAAIVERFVGLELKDYRRIFRTANDNEAGGLDNVARRFAWLRRLLGTYDQEAGRVFPPEWRVGWALFVKFTEITRDDMATLLTRAGANLTVQLLLETLQQTMEFESSTAKKLGAPLGEILRSGHTSAAQAPKSISSVFEPHMGIYVDAQDKALSDMLGKYRGARSRASLDTPAGEDAPATVVLPSSTELFYFYAQSLDSCAKLSVGIGKILLDLAGVQKKWLRTYAGDVLVAGMKRPVAQAVRKSLDSRFDVEELKTACLVINTADYCQTTAEELEQNIRSKLEPGLKDKLTFQPERDLFVNVISSAIQIQIRELEHGVEPALSTLARTSWAAQRQVSGPSPYVGDLASALDLAADAVKQRVQQKKYLRNFFDKAAGLVLAKFTNSIVKSRPLKEIGAEQLLIDLQAVKASLLKFPGEELASSIYTRNITKTSTNLEALLKVIVTSVDPPEGFILNYTLQIGDASFSNFQKVLDLKGTPKPSQNSLLDSFLTITSTQNELQTTSFLSALDMDPPAVLSATTSGINTPTGIQSPRGGEGLLGVVGSPPRVDTPPGGVQEDATRAVFPDFKRLVTFGLRRETMG